MKRTIIIFLITTVAFMACVTQKRGPAYEFPAAMPAAVKADYTRQCDKGKALYEINCAKCHTGKIKGRTIIPDFTPQQLVGYELRIQNPKHEANIPETTVTAEELGSIITFLTYKKRNM